MIVTPEELAIIHGQAVREYPRESCGLILARGTERRVVPCRNIQDELHAKDPAKHPRDARTAYHIDDRELLRVFQSEREGFAVVVIYHSHIDAGAYFSETDRRQALMGGEPMYPQVAYLVSSVRGGVDGPRVDATAGFRWDPVGQDFVTVRLDEGVLQEGRRNA